MKNMPLPLRLSLLAGLLLACGLLNAPSAVLTPTIPATPVTPPTSTPFPPAAATATAVPLPTTTALPATATALPGEPIAISEIRMLDETHGWGWTTQADSSFQLLRTADGGQTWNNVSPKDTALNPSFSFFLDAQNGWIAQFDPDTNASLLLRTSDGGATWSSLPQKDFQEEQNATYTFTTANDGLAETAGLGAGNLYLNLYTSTNGGANWSPILLTQPSPESNLPAGTVHLCNICGDNLYYDPQRTVIAYGDLASPPTGAIRLAISTDLGQTWKDLNLPLPDPKYADEMVAPKSPSFWGNEGVLPINLIKYAADNSLADSTLFIYVTHDGGQSWSAAPGSVDSGATQVETVIALSPADLFVRCGKDLCTTHDGAQTWQHLASSLNFDQAVISTDYVSQFEFVNPASGWAITGDAPATVLWSTTDGGANWNKLSPTLVK